jgi:hypothetical protein
MFVDFQFEAQRSDYRARYGEAGHSIVLIDGAPAGRLWTAKGFGSVHVVASVGRSVSLSVLRDNLGAVRPYLGLGFVPTGGDELRLEMVWTARGGDDQGEGNA